jgi:hypothetical protein
MPLAAERLTMLRRRMRGVMVIREDRTPSLG